VETHLQHNVRIFITTIISLSIVSVVLETVQELEVNYSLEFYIFEVFTVTVFSIEYLLRLWCAVEEPRYSRPIIGRLRYALSPLALVDLIAVLPFYLPALIPIDLRFLRGLRLIRLVRVMKLGHYSRSLTLITTVAKKKRHEMGAALLIVSILLLFASSVMYYVERDTQPKLFSSIPAALWWGVCALTTVGYGDIYPVTTVGKLFSSFISLLALGIIALPSGIFVAGFMEEMLNNRAKVFCARCGAEIDNASNEQRHELSIENP